MSAPPPPPLRRERSAHLAQPRGAHARVEHDLDARRHAAPRDQRKQVRSRLVQPAARDGQLFQHQRGGAIVPAAHGGVDGHRPVVEQGVQRAIVSRGLGLPRGVHQHAHERRMPACRRHEKAVVGDLAAEATLQGKQGRCSLAGAARQRRLSGTARRVRSLTRARTGLPARAAHHKGQAHG
jgi:hypothetical protein